MALQEFQIKIKKCYQSREFLFPTNLHISTGILYLFTKTTSVTPTAKNLLFLNK